MNPEEMNEIFELFAKADFSKWSVQDQLLTMAAALEFATKVKPILLKNEVLNSEQSGTFLFKM